MDSAPQSDGVVARIYPRVHRTRGYGRWVVRIVGILITLGLLIGVALARTPRQKGVCLVLLVATVIGAAIAWLAGADGRLSSSGRELGDYWRTRLGQRF